MFSVLTGDPQQIADELLTHAAVGSYKNSGQRCTAIKRLLVQEWVAVKLHQHQDVLVAVATVAAPPARAAPATRAQRLAKRTNGA